MVPHPVMVEEVKPPLNDSHITIPSIVATRSLGLDESHDLGEESYDQGEGRESESEEEVQDEGQETDEDV